VVEKPNPRYEEEMVAYTAHVAALAKMREETIRRERIAAEGRTAKGQYRKERRLQRIQAKGPIQEGFALQYPDGRFAGIDVNSGGYEYPAESIKDIFVVKDRTLLEPYVRGTNPNSLKIVNISVKITINETDSWVQEGSPMSTKKAQPYAR
jgi:hypothetical protein